MLQEKSFPKRLGKLKKKRNNSRSFTPLHILVNVIILSMPMVTLVKPQKNGKRVNIYIDDKFGFGIDLINFVKNELKVGLELSEEKINEIVKKAEFQKTLDKVLRFATLRPRSEKEIMNYLRRKKIHLSIHEELFEKLKHFGLLDDFVFAKWWVEQRMSFKPKGKRALLGELLEKGIKKDVAEDVLGDSGVDEKRIAKELLGKNVRRWERYDSKEAVKKKTEFLARKGFSWEVIKKALSIDDE